VIHGIFYLDSQVLHTESLGPRRLIEYLGLL